MIALHAVAETGRRLSEVPLSSSGNLVNLWVPQVPAIRSENTAVG